MAAPPTWRDAASGAPNRTQQVPFEERPPPPPKRRWYGWQTLLIDVPSLALWIAGAEAVANSNSKSGYAPVGIGFAGYVLGAPIVHAAHGHWGKAGASIGFRVGTILVGVAGAVGCLNDHVFTSGECGEGYTALLVVGSLGILAAVAVDAAVIAREDVKPDRVAHVRVYPWVADRGRGVGLMLGGAL